MNNTPVVPASFEFKRVIHGEKSILASCFNERRLRLLVATRNALTLYSLRSEITRIRLENNCKVSGLLYNQKDDFYIAIFNGNQVRVYNGNLEEQMTFVGHNRRISASCFHKSRNELFVGSSEGSVICWRFSWERKEDKSSQAMFARKREYTNTKKWSATPADVRSNCEFLYMDEDRNILYHVSHSDIHVWNGISGEHMYTCTDLHDEPITYMDLKSAENDNDLVVVTASVKGDTRVWKLRNKKAVPVISLQSHSKRVNSVLFDLDEPLTYFSAGHDRSLRHWQVDSARMADEFSMSSEGNMLLHSILPKRITQLHLFKAGPKKLLIAISDTDILHFEIREFLSYFSECSSAIMQMELCYIPMAIEDSTPFGAPPTVQYVPHMVALSTNSAIQVAEMPNGVTTALLAPPSKKQQPQPPPALGMSGGSHVLNPNIKPAAVTSEITYFAHSTVYEVLLLGWSNGTVDLVDPVGGRCVATCEHCDVKSAVTCIAPFLVEDGASGKVADPIEHIWCSSEDGYITRWSLQPPKLLFAFRAHQEFVVQIQHIPNRDLIFSVSITNVVRTWNITQNCTLNCEMKLTNPSMISRVLVLESKFFICGYVSGAIEIFRFPVNARTAAQDSRPLRSRANVHHGRITSLTLSPDKTLFTVTSLDGKISIWDVRNFNLLKCFPVNCPVTQVTFTPFNDGSLAIVALNDCMNLISVERPDNDGDPDPSVAHLLDVQEVFLKKKTLPESQGGRGESTLPRRSPSKSSAQSKKSVTVSVPPKQEEGVTVKENKSPEEKDKDNSSTGLNSRSAPSLAHMRTRKNLFQSFRNINDSNAIGDLLSSMVPEKPKRVFNARGVQVVGKEELSYLDNKQDPIPNNAKVPLSRRRDSALMRMSSKGSMGADDELADNISVTSLLTDGEQMPAHEHNTALVEANRDLVRYVGKVKKRPPFSPALASAGYFRSEEKKSALASRGKTDAFAKNNIRPRSSISFSDAFSLGSPGSLSASFEHTMHDVKSVPNLNPPSSPQPRPSTAGSLSSIMMTKHQTELSVRHSARLPNLTRFDAPMSPGVVKTASVFKQTEVPPEAKLYPAVVQVPLRNRQYANLISRPGASSLDRLGGSKRERPSSATPSMRSRLHDQFDAKRIKIKYPTPFDYDDPESADFPGWLQWELFHRPENISKFERKALPWRPRELFEVTAPEPEDEGPKVRKAQDPDPSSWGVAPMDISRVRGVLDDLDFSSDPADLPDISDYSCYGESETNAPWTNLCGTLGDAMDMEYLNREIKTRDRPDDIIVNGVPQPQEDDSSSQYTSKSQEVDSMNVQLDVIQAGLIKRKSQEFRDSFDADEFKKKHSKRKQHTEVATKLGFGEDDVDFDLDSDSKGGGHEWLEDNTGVDFTESGSDRGQEDSMNDLGDADDKAVKKVQIHEEPEDESSKESKAGEKELTSEEQARNKMLGFLSEQAEAFKLDDIDDDDWDAVNMLMTLMGQANEREEKVDKTVAHSEPESEWVSSDDESDIDDEFLDPIIEPLDQPLPAAATMRLVDSIMSVTCAKGTGGAPSGAEMDTSALTGGSNDVDFFVEEAKASVEALVSSFEIDVMAMPEPERYIFKPSKYSANEEESQMLTDLMSFTDILGNVDKENPFKRSHSSPSLITELHLRDKPDEVNMLALNNKDTAMQLNTTLVSNLNMFGDNISSTERLRRKPATAPRETMEKVHVPEYHMLDANDVEDLTFDVTVTFGDQFDLDDAKLDEIKAIKQAVTTNQQQKRKQRTSVEGGSSKEMPRMESALQTVVESEEMKAGLEERADSDGDSDESGRDSYSVGTFTTEETELLNPSVASLGTTDSGNDVDCEFKSRFAILKDESESEDDSQMVEEADFRTINAGFFDTMIQKVRRREARLMRPKLGHAVPSLLGAEKHGAVYTKTSAAPIHQEVEAAIDPSDKKGNDKSKKIGVSLDDEDGKENEQKIKFNALPFKPRTVDPMAPFAPPLVEPKSKFKLNDLREPKYEQHIEEVLTEAQLEAKKRRNRLAEQAKRRDTGLFRRKKESAAKRERRIKARSEEAAKAMARRLKGKPPPTLEERAEVINMATSNVDIDETISENSLLFWKPPPPPKTRKDRKVDIPDVSYPMTTTDSMTAPAIAD